jgi:predicted RNase H-like HicB family nuclease
MPQRRYLILIEAGQPAFSAYAPDLPGATREDVEHEMHDPIAFHLEGLHEAVEPIPEPSGLTAAYVKVAA